MERSESRKEIAERFHVSEDVINEIQTFIIGEKTVLEFMERFNASDEIAGFLEQIIDWMENNRIQPKRKPLESSSYMEQFIKEYAQRFLDLSDEWKQDPPKVGAFLKRLSPNTASGAEYIHSIVADIYYQVDTSLIKTNKYEEEYEFSIEVLPGYLSGGITAEDYVSQFIMPHYPASMKKGERKRLVREEIRKKFVRECKGYPRWLQEPEWPMDEDGEPMVYTGQKSFGDYSEYYFRGRNSEERKTVTQWW